MTRTYLKFFFIAALVVPMMSFASEDAAEHEPVATRKPTIAMPTGEEAEQGNSKYITEYTPVYYPSGIHGLAAKAIGGSTIELEDGSVWKINAYDQHKVANFQFQDAIVITQNHRWFSRYNYKLINQATGSSLEANLQLGPLKGGVYTRYIIGVDTAHGELILDDHSSWRISFYDANVFQDWMLHDAVIIGTNSGWDSGCQGLLINVNMNQSIRAEQF